MLGKGDKVRWADRDGELTGTVRYVVVGFEGWEAKAVIDCDQVKAAGGVPIGRVEHVPLDRLELIEGASDDTP